MTHQKQSGEHDGIAYFDIPKYGDGYAVTKCGKVFSKISQRWLKTPLGRAGYPRFRVRLNNEDRTLRVHRAMGFTFLGVPDVWPYGFEIDHINRDRSDCQLTNLRVIPHSANIKNRPKVFPSVLHSKNTSGVSGVSFFPSYGANGSWVAKLGRKRIGAFKTMDEAIHARREAENSTRVNEVCKSGGQRLQYPQEFSVVRH